MKACSPIWFRVYFNSFSAKPHKRGHQMLGWHISIYKQKDGSLLPGTAVTPKGPRLAVWQTGLGGLDWLDELVKANKAISLGENCGYPCRYTATAECLVPH